MKPYPVYKDSGVEWLGPVPEGWDVVPLKRRFSVRLGKMLQPASRATEDFEASYLRAANIQWSGVDLSDVKTMWFNEVEAEALTLKRGDLLVSEGGDVGRSAIIEADLGEVYFQNSVNRVRARARDCTRFLYYWMSVIKARGYVDVLCNKSTIAHFTAEKVEAVPVPFPPLPEQQAIAAFLDRKTAKIDGLIEEQRRLIALLAEKRQATISHAVTRGLNPSARLKPSGVDWLGDIPEGWEVVPLKRLGRFAAGTGFPHEEQGIEGEELPFFKVNALGKAGTDAVLLPADVDTISRETACRLRATIFPKGAIVFAKIGAALLLGRIRTLPCEACIDNNMMGFYPLNSLHANYIKFAMSLLRFDLISNPGTVPSLNEGQIAEQRIPFPRLSE